MDPDQVIKLISGLSNFGGMALLSGVLLWLHVNSLKTFRQELQAERDQCHEDHEKLFSVMQEANNRLHELILTLRDKR